ncbi:Guanylate cyclase [Aphelenchoides fujianensis]|nr:Guanylate cyclase [Aphelenchoides fujianensis]
MMLIEGGEQVVYLASPYVTNVAELTAFGLKLSAFAPHDATRDLILMNQQRLSDVEDNRLLDETTAKLNALTKELEELKERTFSLLSEALPQQVAEKLESGRPVEPQEFEDVTVIFVDIPDLQEMIDHSSADETVAVLAELHQRYDRLVHLHEVVKIEGLNETFVVAAGLPHEHADHAECALHVALGLEYKARLIENPHKKEPLLVRCGVHVGSVVAGVVQVGTPSFCLFGECVQTAARLCAATTAGGILVSDAAKRAAERTARFEFERAPAVRLTAHETLQTHRLKRSFKKSIWEIVNRQRDENVNTIDGYEELNKILDANKKNSRARSNVCNLL